MKKSKDDTSKVLLLGPPNVGKSALFNKLTGLEAVISNYSGTTIDYKEGFMKESGKKFHIVDVPGTYTLKATNEAEKVAVDMLESGADLVVVVMDGNSIESSLYLLLQAAQKDIPILTVVNRIDLLEKKGFKLDKKKFVSWLDLPLIETVAVNGRGIDKLKDKIKAADENKREFMSDKQIVPEWEAADQLTSEMLVAHEGLKDTDCSRKKLGNMLCKPWPGIPLAIIILGFVFALVVGVGMGVRQYILLPFFESLIFPLITNSVKALVPPGTFQSILIGEYGFLIKGLEWPFALVFPYVISFYTGLSLLEDAGYLPRLGVLLDGLFKKIGLSGGTIIPLLLGYGCAIPGIAATRALPTEKERIMVSSLICLSVPCISQTGAMISLLAEESLFVMAGVFSISILALIAVGLILAYILPGERESTVVEIPPLQFSGKEILGRKILIRIKSYLTNGALMMIYAIGGAAVLFETGVLEYIGRLLQPIVENWLLLPAEASIPLMLGIVRRELAVLPLLEMNLTTIQLFVGALVALFYIPCVAVLAMGAREFNLKFSGGVLLFTLIFSFLAGGLAARIGRLLTILL